MNSHFIGIDTGINGACVAIDQFGSLIGSRDLPHIKAVPCYRLKKTRSVLDIKALKKWLQCFDIERIVVEESASYHMGNVSAYTSGFNNGRLHAICLDVVGESRFTPIPPKLWQKDLFGDIIKDTNWTKEESIRQAKKAHGELILFEKPIRTADGYADSCHIAEWGRSCYER